MRILLDMEATGCQTEPMDPQDILNLLGQKSLELEKKTRVSAAGIQDQDEIHSVELIDGEVHFNSCHNNEIGGSSGNDKKSSPKEGTRKSISKSSTSSSSKAHEPTSLSDKICEAVWSRKGSFHATGASRSGSSKSKKHRLERSQSFCKGLFMSISIEIKTFFSVFVVAT